jgi:hypothetical protein
MLFRSELEAVRLELEVAWREGRDRKVLERRMRELRFVNNLEIDSLYSGEMRTFTKRPMRLPQLLIDSSAFQVHAHRLGTPSQATYLHPLLAILNLNRFIVPSIMFPSIMFPFTSLALLSPPIDRSTSTASVASPRPSQNCIFS